MKSITCTSAKKRLSDTMKSVCDDHGPVAITSKRDRTVVIISPDDYEALQETTYLMRSPRNVKRLVSSILELEKDKEKIR